MCKACAKYLRFQKDNKTKVRVSNLQETGQGQGNNSSQLIAKKCHMG